MDAGKIRLSHEDIQAVRDVADKANAVQGDRNPKGYMESIFAILPRFELDTAASVLPMCMYTLYLS